MKLEEILRFFAENPKLVKSQQENSIHKYLIPTDQLSLEIIPQIGSFKGNEKAKLDAELQQLIDHNPGMAVAGRYSLQNYTNRPHVLFIVIRSQSPTTRENPLIALYNINPGIQIITLISPLLWKTLTAWNLMLQFIEQLEKHFIFAAGDDFIAQISKIYSQDRQMYNIVYHLRTDTQPYQEQANKPLPDRLEWLMFSSDTLKNPDIDSKLLLLGSFYHYNYSKPEFIKYLQSAPHLLIVDQNKVVAGCRANSYCPEYAIIGGVSNIKEYRHRGIGKIMCAKFVAFLVGHVKEVFLETDEKNIPARKIYNALGFVEIGHSLFINHGSGIIDNIMNDRDY